MTVSLFRACLILLFVTLNLQPVVVQADPVIVQPFYISNQNPVIQIFGLPRAESSTIVKENSLEVLFAMDVVSNTVKGDNANETLILDGETYRYNFLFQYGLNNGVDIDFVLPWVKHSRGRFDNFIRDWHDFIGLSNEEQNQFTANNLNYFYEYKGDEILNITRDSQGMGDIRLGVTFDLHDVIKTPQSNLSLKLELKLPTGQSELLLGSGATDLAVTVTANDEKYEHENFIAFHGQAGLILAGKSDLFEDIQKRYIVYGSAGINWFYWQPLILQAQLDLHSPFYHSDVAHLGKGSVQLTLGGTLIISSSTRLDIGVTENLVTDTTPDVGLNLVLRTRY